MNTTELIRKQAINLSKKYICKGSGSNLEVLLNKKIQKEMDINELIKHTKFVVVGGVATNYYMPQRNTMDTDILILVENY